MIKIVRKILFVISLIPYVFILLCSVYSSFVGFSFLPDGTATYGIQGFVESVAIWCLLLWVIGSFTINKQNIDVVTDILLEFVDTDKFIKLIKESEKFMASVEKSVGTNDITEEHTDEELEELQTETIDSLKKIRTAVNSLEEAEFVIRTQTFENGSIGNVTGETLFIIMTATMKGEVLVQPDKNVNYFDDNEFQAPQRQELDEKMTLGMKIICGDVTINLPSDNESCDLLEAFSAAAGSDDFYSDDYYDDYGDFSQIDVIEEMEEAA